MRAALICLPQPGEPASPVIAGRSVLERQIAFALACGCTRILAHCPGFTAELADLRYRAEAGGARFTQLSTVHALPGAIDDSDVLLVMHPDLLPESRAALGVLAAEEAILVLPAGAGAQAGFERIDLDRAWAGTLVVRGELLGALSGLAEDAAPAPALLRIALQAKVPEHRLPETAIADAEWVLVRSQDAAGALQPKWLRRALGESSGWSLSRNLAHLVLRANRGTLALFPWLRNASLALFALAIAVAIALGWSALAPLSFLALALAAIMVEVLLGSQSLRAAPFGTLGHWSKLRLIADAALFALAAMAFDSLWYREIFAAFALVASLWLLDRRAPAGPLALLRDRLTVSAVLLAASLAGMAEPGILLLASLLLLAILALDARSGG